MMITTNGKTNGKTLLAQINTQFFRERRDYYLVFEIFHLRDILPMSVWNIHQIYKCILEEKVNHLLNVNFEVADVLVVLSRFHLGQQQRILQVASAINPICT